MRQLFLLIFLFAGFTFSTYSEESSHSSDFNLVEFALHHVADSYSWDFYHKKDGSVVGIELPRILFDRKNTKLYFFASTKKAEKAGFIQEHEFNHSAMHGVLLTPDAHHELEHLYQQKKASTDTTEIEQLKQQISSKIKEFKPLDFSITKNVLFMFFATILLLWIFISIANKYKANPGKAPKGLQSALEPIIVFIRDDIAKTYIPHHYEKFLPLLLNFFFFIWFLNMMGLIPFSANVTGNIAVTASLAIITMLVTNLNARKNYWIHIFWFPGVPVFVKPIMFIVELVSVFTKPFALTIRLFANITAGHLVILSFVSLIFIFGKLGAVPVAGWGTSVISVAFALFIDMIEILIALLQAYIFTTLSALFIGQAVESNH